MSVYRFEDLIAWQRARTLTLEIYRTTRGDPFARDLGLCQQVQRAAVSVMSNIAEGFEKQNRREFGRYLDISKGSLAEVRSLLYVALDVGYITASRSEELFLLVDGVGKVLAGLRRSLTREHGTGNLAAGTS